MRIAFCSLITRAGVEVSGMGYSIPDEDSRAMGSGGYPPRETSQTPKHQIFATLRFAENAVKIQAEA
jgi:hypothetical protein